MNTSNTINFFVATILVCVSYAAMSKNVYFLLVAGFLALCVAVIKTRENFETILTDYALENVLDVDRNVCVPFRQLGRNAPFIIKELRLKNMGHEDDTSCYINMKDMLFDGNESCSKSNSRIYNNKFSDIIENISKDYDIDDDQTKMTSTEVCKIKFKPQTLDRSLEPQLLNYARYLDDNDPIAANCRKQIDNLHDTNTQLQSNISNLKNDLSKKSIELQNVSNQNTTCNTRLSTANSTINSLSRNIQSLNSQINTLNSQLHSANVRANSYAAQINPFVRQVAQPTAVNTSAIDVIGMATQFNSVGRGASSKDLWFAYYGKINTKFRIQGWVNGVVTTSPLELPVYSNSFRGPDIRIVLGRPFTGHIYLQRWVNNQWTHITTVGPVNNITTHVFKGATQVGDYK